MTFGSKIFWVVYMLSSGHLQPMPGSPWFSTADDCFAALPRFASSQIGVTCQPESKAEIVIEYDTK